MSPSDRVTRITPITRPFVICLRLTPHPYHHPPISSTRFTSVSLLVLWHTDNSTHAPFRHSTDRESPQFTQ